MGYDYRDLEEYVVGSFELGNEVDITDPCYDKDTWCRTTTECVPGEYYGVARVIDDGEWGKRVADLSIYKNYTQKIYRDEDFTEFVADIGVDAGLAGFFNNKPDFKGDEWTQFLHDIGTYKEDGEYDYDKRFYSIDYGIISESGYGDGCYCVYSNKEKTAFRIIFIGDDSEDEYEDDYEEDDEE